MVHQGAFRDWGVLLADFLLQTFFYFLQNAPKHQKVLKNHQYELKDHQKELGIRILSFESTGG